MRNVAKNIVDLRSTFGRLPEQERI